MATDEEKSVLREKLEEYEGRVPHMYLDANGYVTVGVGHLVKTLADALELPFINARSERATAEEIKADFDQVRKQPKNRLATFYKKSTKLRLTDVEIDKLTDAHIDTFESELKEIYSEFSLYPMDVKFALFDLIFNLGMTNLRNTWPTFNAAVEAKDWLSAAENCHRAAPVSAARNNYVKALLEKAATTAVAAASEPKSASANA